MTGVAEVLVTAGAAVIAVTTIVSGVLWLVLPRVKGWIQREITVPVQATHHQVSVNHHTSKDPTLLDKFDDLGSQVGAISTEMEALSSEVKSLSAQVEARDQNVNTLYVLFDEHLRWSREWTLSNGREGLS